MAKKKISLSPEQVKHNEISNRMQKENLYICEYCDIEISKAGLVIALFRTLKPDWCLNNATGKMSCPNPDCFAKAKAEQELAKSRGAFHY